MIFLTTLNRKEADMKEGSDKTLEIFCAAIALKERKKSLYDEAMKSCPDAVGVETFRMLKVAEDGHLEQIKAVYEEAKKGKVPADACQFHDFGTVSKKTYLRRISEERGRIRKACLDDVAAIETGMQLENEAIEFFGKHYAAATDAEERKFLEGLMIEEREHHKLLADLKFYYEDTENWFLEKGHQVLDGAGAGT
jgi:rubrerythrin